VHPKKKKNPGSAPAVDAHEAEIKEIFVVFDES